MDFMGVCTPYKMLVMNIIIMTIKQIGGTVTYLSSLCFFTAPLSQINQALILQRGIQLDVHGALV